jgi:CheY-like chemotaxis protein
VSGELAFLVHPQEQSRSRVSAALQGAGFKVVTAAGLAAVSQSLESLRLSAPDLVLAPLDAFDAAGGDVARELFQGAPLVVLGDGREEQRRRALRLGLTHLVQPPYDGEEVVLTARLALERHRDGRVLTGSLEQLSAADLLQTAEASRRSGIVRFRQGGPGNRQGSSTGTVWLRDGRIVDAELSEFGGNRVRGAEAVYEIALWDGGVFEADFTAVPVPERIFQPTSALLLEAMRRRDEAMRSAAPPSAALPDPPPPPPRPLMALHRGLTLLNVAASYALDHVEPGVLQKRLEETRRALLPEHPVLSSFEVRDGGAVAVAPGGEAAALDPDSTAALVRAVARWLARLFAVLERALPGRFPLQRLRAITEAVRDDLGSFGFYRELGLEAGPRE